MVVDVENVKRDILDKAKNEEIIITKNNKPFLVVMDFEKFKKLNDYDFWSEDEIKRVGYIGLEYSSFDDDGEDYSKW